MTVLAMWVAVAAVAGSAAASPVEFGREELRRAFESRGMQPVPVATAITGGAAESYVIEGQRITGGDERGLMYGLLEAAEQVLQDGRIEAATGKPATKIRGLRTFLHNEDLEEDWYYSHEYWDEFLAHLARNRFNRFNLVFAHQTQYLAPPYPYWLDLKEFPEIRVQRLSNEQRERNLATLRYISETAAAHGIDLTLGIWEHNVQTFRVPPMMPSVNGITRQNVGPYSYAALKRILQLCPAIRSVQFRTNRESGIPDDQGVEFFRDYVYRAIRDAGRPVTLEVRGWAMSPGMLDAAVGARLPLRLSSKYWAEDMGRPYQPAETFPGYSFLDFLKKRRPYDFYWEIWMLGSHRLLLWGDPDYVRRAISTFGLGGASGFEIDAPLAQKGHGNRPGKWGIFTTAERDRTFWKYEYERYWLFYKLWGRLSYSPSAPDSIWLHELEKRVGPAAADVAAAYKSSSRVITEIVAAHMANPNMYIWPEINPGGLVAAYKDVPPSDWRYIARVDEAVRNRLNGVASAKQTPLDTAALLDRTADETERAVAAAWRKAAVTNPEWVSSESDFMVLAAMARYHARKQKAAYFLTWFLETGDLAALRKAKAELKTGLSIWTELTRRTDGLYPDQMAFGPSDYGHWKDKLPYVRFDVEWIEEMEKTAEKYADFQYRFDFGGALVEPSERPYRNQSDRSFIRGNTLMARFQPVHADSKYSDAAGYGWASDGARVENVLTLTPYYELAAVRPNPIQLPRNVLLGDSIEGRGSQVFRVRTGEGTFDAQLLKPDGSTIRPAVTTANGLTDVVFPEGEWNFSGLVLRNAAGNRSVTRAEKPPRSLARPSIRHSMPPQAKARQPLELAVSASPAGSVTAIRLHYRELTQLDKFKTIEAKGASAKFSIPGDEITGQFDLQYYFEVLNSEVAGWFHPDPAQATPYYVVDILE